MQQVSVLETNIGSSTTGNSSNTQVIFNDNGTLRGDAGLTYNATTDTLTVGAATITGNLTVTGAAQLNSNVGVGFPLSAWGGGRKAVQIGSPAQLVSSDLTLEIGSNWWYDGTNYRYTATNPACLYSPSNGSHIWYNAVSGTAGTNIGWATLMTLNATGLGVGVTPKSWASGYRALQLGIYSALTDAQGGATYLTNNAYFDSVDSRWEYITNNRVVRYDQDTADGGHKWYSAAAGAVNAAINWGNPLMTLDTNGNLILQSPSTPPTLTTNGQLTVNATSNTNLRFSYRGSDGTTRVANITLA